MKLLTALQFAVVSSLADGPLSGKELRSRLSSRGIKKAGPSFYQLMHRMVEAGLVEARYFKSQLGDQDYTECCYKITAAGIKAHKRTQEFYR